MALHTTLDVVNESPNKPEKIDNETLEFVFGKPDSHESKPEAMEMVNDNMHVSKLAFINKIYFKIA